MKQHPDHTQNLVALRRIEGQIRGIQKMVGNRQYCVDILTQIQSAIGALYSVENKIFQKHLGGCVVSAFKGKSEMDKQRKIEEIMELIAKLRKAA